MNKKRWIWASVVVFIIMAALEAFFNNVCLKKLYEATMHLWRPEAELVRLMPFMWVANLVAAFLFSYIYVKGYEGKGPGLTEGLRYGLIIGLFVSIPMAVVCYVTMPIPFELSLSWFATGMFEYLVAGAAVGLIYKK